MFHPIETHRQRTEVYGNVLWMEHLHLLNGASCLLEEGQMFTMKILIDPLLLQALKTKTDENIYEDRCFTLDWLQILKI